MTIAVTAQKFAETGQYPQFPCLMQHPENGYVVLAVAEVDNVLSGILVSDPQGWWNICDVGSYRKRLVSTSSMKPFKGTLEISSDQTLVVREEDTFPRIVEGTVNKTLLIFFDEETGYCLQPNGQMGGGGSWKVGKKMNSDLYSLRHDTKPWKGEITITQS